MATSGGIEGLLKRLALGSFHEVCTWVGPAPQGPFPVLEIVEARINAESALRMDQVHVLDRKDAEVWLALFATQSLLHGGSPLPGQDLHAEIRQGFEDLKPDARFFALGEWQFTRRGKQYERVEAGGPWEDARRYSLHFTRDGPSLSTLTDDGGIIGFDAHNAFIFWVAEDD